jgi:hypothetical protein
LGAAGRCPGRRENFRWTFHGLPPKKRAESTGRASIMNGKKIFGILAGLMLVFVLTWPLAAAEKSFELTVPGCTA